MFSHTLKASYCWNVSRFCLNTSIGLPPTPPNQIQFAMGQLLCSARTTLKPLLMRKHIMVLDQIIPLFSFHLNPYYVSAMTSPFFGKCLSVCWSVSLSCLYCGESRETAMEVLGRAAVDVYPAAATRWSMITAERLSLWDASSSGGCC